MAAPAVACTVCKDDPILRKPELKHAFLRGIKPIQESTVLQISISQNRDTFH